MVSYKNQLQEYLQKSSRSLPIYETVKEGPPHCPKFKSTVIADEVRYDSPLEFPTMRAAEDAAAQIALEDLVKKADANGTIPNALDSTLSKNILQEYTQKMNLELPAYTFTKIGPSHSPTFRSTVKVGRDKYSGGAAATKKKAESKASQIALLAIQAQGTDGAQMAPESASGSQLDDRPGLRRDRNLEGPSEGYNDANQKRTRTAMDLEGASSENASAALAQELGEQPQVNQEEAHGEQQSGQAVALSRTVNMTDGRVDKGKGRNRHSRRKNRKNKKARNHGHQ